MLPRILRVDNFLSKKEIEAYIGPSTRMLAGILHAISFRASREKNSENVVDLRVDCCCHVLPCSASDLPLSHC